MTDQDAPKPPAGMAEVSAKFEHAAEAAAGAPPSSTGVPDDLLTALVVDYYAAYIARDAADDAREEAGNKAAEADNEAARIEDDTLTAGGVYLSLVFDHAGTLTPTREQVSRYSSAFPPADKHTEAVMQHLEEYGERCVAALEAAGWPEKHAKFERAKQRMDALFDQMVQTPAQGLRGIAAKVKGLVFPHEWEFLRDGKLDDFDDQINTDMLVSLVADVERLAGEVVPIGHVSMIEDPVLVLKREWKVRWERYANETDDSEEVTDPLHDRVNETVYEIFQTPATTPAGVAFKLVLWARHHITRGTKENPDWPRPPVTAYPSLDLDHLPVVSALHDLERLAQGIAASLTKDPVPAMIQRYRAVRDDANARIKAMAECPDETFTAIFDPINDQQRECFAAPATTVAGVLAKVRLYYEEKHPGWEELDQDAADVLRDLERIGRTTTVVETPPVEDTALFDALAEYDRLAGIAQNLESRAEVFRPGIPEAEEATKAHEAAYDKASEAWTRARDIPVTTQAGLCTKLQAAIRFTDNLGEDELYEAEWDAIKSDVRRITGEGTATRRPTVTTPAAASSASDPVAQIGRDLAQIWRQVWRNDDDQKSSEAHSSERNRQVRLDFSLADRREALETMAAEIQAGSLEGAMVQIMLAHAEADVMAASTEESNEAQMRTISKLLYSVLAAIEQVADVPREELGGKAYLTRDLDPHALLAGSEVEGTT